MSGIDMSNTLADVGAERMRQIAKWGDQSGHEDTYWYTIHGEEYGEIGRAILEHDPVETYRKLVQLAATCVAHAEALRKKGIR